MHVGTQSHGHWHNHVHAGQPTRGERLIARHDQDNDGKLSTVELKDTRLGKRMSVDRFARLDRNGDGMLEAGEIGRKRLGRHDGPSVMERVMVARLADHLAERVEPADQGADIADAIFARLDKDGSEGLNSEEIAGTRLAEMIGARFYDLDGDKNGVLDKAELSAFIVNDYLGPEQGDDAPDVAAPDGDVTNVGSGPIDLPEDADVAVTAFEPEVVAEIAPETGVNEARAAEAIGPSGSSQTDYADQVRASFEAALKVLQDGSDQRSALEVVRTLYSDVNGILDGA